MARHRSRAALRLFFPILLSSLLLPSVPRASANGSPQEPLRITGIQAKLFLDGKGTFSPDVLADPGFALWNTSVGGGSAGAPSNSTLVLVEVAGPSGVFEASRQVGFEAKYKHGRVSPGGAVVVRDVLVKKTATIGTFGEDGKCYVGFWLYDTGCDPVKLAARLVGQAQPSTMEKTIDFKCGE